MAHPKVMIIGSDNASDLYGSKLADNLKLLRPDISLFGIGGPKMRDAGIRLLYNIFDLDNLGVVESIKGAHLMKRLVQRLNESMDRLQPDLVIQIGLPVSNFRLIELAHSKGIPVLYYYTPLSMNFADLKLSRLQSVVDKVLAVTRYEERICKEAQIDVEFVGHPLLDLVSPSQSVAESKAQWSLSDALPIVSVLPGQREVEVKAVLPTLLRGLKRVQDKGQNVQVIVSHMSVLSEERMNTMIKNSGLDDVRVISNIYDVLNVADLALVTCGCTSLEAALMGKPSLAVHKVAATSYLLDKMLTHKSYFSMVNFLLEKLAMPELVQSNLTESKVAKEIIRLLADTDLKATMVTEFKRLPDVLGSFGAIERATQAVLVMLDQDTEDN